MQGQKPPILLYLAKKNTYIRQNRKRIKKPCFFQNLFLAQFMCPPYKIFSILFFLLFVSFMETLYAQDDTIDSITNATFFSNDDEGEAQEQNISNKIQDTDEIESKILHLEILSNIDELNNQTLYVGQYITIQYRLMLLNDARIVYTEFNPSLEQNPKDKKPQSVALIHEGEWQKTGEYYQSSFTFKILDTNVLIPSLVVHVQNNVMQDSMQTDSIALNAQSLVANPQYCGVVANNLKIVDTTLENYDENTNMILIEVEAMNSNLEDFRLPNIKDQEFGQGAKFGSDIARVNVLARIPKSLTTIEFSYFDINKRDFIPITTNLVNATSFDDEVKEDLNPKSSFLRIANIAILVVLAFFLLMTIIKRSYFYAIISCCLAGFLIYKIFSNTYSIKTLPNTRVLILPTHNSTELLLLPNATKLEAIDKKNDYYKVNIDSKVGWISRQDTNKK